MAYTYDDFVGAATAAGLLDRFSQADLDTAMKYPEFGLSILSLKKDYRDATTDEQRLLANEAANALRSSYGNYTGGEDGSQYYSQGKIPGQIDNILDQMNSFGSFSYDVAAPVYDNQYAAQQQALLDAILNREDFSWSKETDPLWPVYKKQYLREGERATDNALARASAASGGRASSYAVNAATQAGDYYATQLNDIIPTLYQQAYDRYVNEYSMKLQDLGAVNTQEQMDYAKYLDQLTQHNTDRNFAYNQYLDEYSRLQSTLGALQSQDAVDYGRYLDGINLDMQQEQQAFDNAMQMYATYGYVPEGMGEILGLPEGTPTADQSYNEWYMQQQAAKQTGGTGGGNGSGAGRGSGYNNGSLTTEQIKQMQTALGVTPDGKWGPNTTAAAGGLSADEYWAQMGGGGGDITGTVAAFQAGDHSDATIKALLDAGYTQAQIEAAGYSGNYFKPTDTPTVNVPTTEIDGKSFAEYEAAAGNYQGVRDLADQMLAGGSSKQDVLNMIKEAWSSGALNTNDYMSLYNKYRG